MRWKKIGTSNHYIPSLAVLDFDQYSTYKCRRVVSILRMEEPPSGYGVLAENEGNVHARTDSILRQGIMCLVSPITVWENDAIFQPESL